MEELSIKIKIAEREYPMRALPSEEERLRLAGKLINEKIKEYRDQFKIDDKQDLLAMVAFECLVEKLKLETENQETTATIDERISKLNFLIRSVVSRNT